MNGFIRFESTDAAYNQVQDALERSYVDEYSARMYKVISDGTIEIGCNLVFACTAYDASIIAAYLNQVSHDNFTVMLYDEWMTLRSLTAYTGIL